MKHETDRNTSWSWCDWNRPQGLRKLLKESEIRESIETIQSTVILTSTRIFRRVLKTSVKDNQLKPVWRIRKKRNNNSHKVYPRNHEKLESGIDSRREKIRWCENPDRYIPGRCAITIIICSSDDFTWLPT